MTITITMELNEQNLDKLKALLPDATMEVKSEAKQMKKVKEQKQEKVAAEPVEEQKEEQKEEHVKDWLPQDTAYTDKVATPPQPKKQEETITKEDIRAAALVLSQAKKNDKIAEIFAKFGAKKLTDFDNKKESYPALLEELKNAATC